jgi:hypothetical protein
MAVERAVQALWAFHERPGPGGAAWAAIDGCSTLAQYRSELERSPGNLIQAARAFLPDFAGLTPAEAGAIAVLIEISDALRLKPRRSQKSGPQHDAFSHLDIRERSGRSRSQHLVVRSTQLVPT